MTPKVEDPLLAPPPSPRHVLTSFREALTLVSTKSAELRIAEAEVLRADALERQALGQTLPTLNATGNVTHHLIRGDIKTVDLEQAKVVERRVPDTPIASAQLTLSQPFAPRAWYAVGTSALGLERARTRAEDRYRTVIIGLTNSILAVFTTERSAEINRVGLRSALQRLDLTRRMVALGTGTQLDLVRVEQDSIAARAGLIAGDEVLRQAREALGLLLGSVESYGVTPSLQLNELQSAFEISCRPGSVADRADVRAATADVMMASRGVADAKLMFAPFASVATTGVLSNDELLNAKKYAWSIQGLVTLPLWDGGVRYGALRAARADVEQQQTRLDATVRNATVEVTQALRALDVAQDQLRIAARSAELAHQTASLAQKAFEAGTTTSFDLVETARREREAELTLAVRELDLAKAKLAALLATASCSPHPTTDAR